MSATDLDQQRQGVQLLLLLAVFSCLLVAAKLYVGAMDQHSKKVFCLNLAPPDPTMPAPVPARRYRTVAVKMVRPVAARPVRAIGSKKYAKIIKKASTEQGVDPHLVTAVIKVESNFHVGAKSGKGAKGLMQLMPGTVKAMGIKNPLDPRQNILAGAKYLAHLLKMFDYRLRLALAAYNAGPTAVMRHGGIPPYAETENFVRKVLHYYADLQSTNG